jgi:hypothetical protein
MITGDIESKKKIEGEVGKICWCQHVTKHKTCRVFSIMTSISLYVYTQHIRRGGRREMRNPGGAKRKIFENTNMMIA